jgi:hypothetical protein
MRGARGWLTFTSYWVYIPGLITGTVLAVGIAFVLRGRGGGKSGAGVPKVSCSPKSASPANPEDPGLLAISAACLAKPAGHAGTEAREAAASSPVRPLPPAAVTMTAEPPHSPVTEAVRSLEVRWIFPGQLETTVARWFSRFPATTESREDTYLLDPQMRGLSVKVRGGRALEVRVYRGSPGILLQLPGRARGHWKPGRNGPFPSARSAGTAAIRPAGSRSARDGGSAGSRWPAGGPRRAPRCPAASRGARWNSPRSALAARTGGPWDSMRPAQPICSTANCRPPPRSFSPSPCP